MGHISSQQYVFYHPNNSISGTGNGISGIDSSNLTISNNFITAASAFGIKLQNTTATVENNEVIGADQGIHLINCSAAESTIRNNKFIGTGYGIYLQGSKALITNNTATGTQAGACVVSSAAMAVTLRNNIITGTAGPGIDVRSSQNVTIDNNEIHGSDNAVRLPSPRTLRY